MSPFFFLSSSFPTYKDIRLLLEIVSSLDRGRRHGLPAPPAAIWGLAGSCPSLALSPPCPPPLRNPLTPSSAHAQGRGKAQAGLRGHTVTFVLLELNLATTAQDTHVCLLGQAPSSLPELGAFGELCLGDSEICRGHGVRSGGSTGFGTLGGEGAAPIELGFRGVRGGPGGLGTLWRGEKQHPQSRGSTG